MRVCVCAHHAKDLITSLYTTRADRLCDATLRPVWTCRAALRTRFPPRTSRTGFESARLVRPCLPGVFLVEERRTRTRGPSTASRDSSTSQVIPPPGSVGAGLERPARILHVLTAQSQEASRRVRLRLPHSQRCAVHRVGWIVARCRLRFATLRAAGKHSEFQVTMSKGHLTTADFELAGSGGPCALSLLL